MNRLQEIGNKIKLEWPKNLGTYRSQCPQDFYNGMCQGIELLLEAIKPEIELMLKEQDKIVRNAAYDEAQKYQNENHLIGNLPSMMMNLQHDWVELEEDK